MASKITYTPYRGSIETIIKVYNSDINFYKNYVEVISNYEFNNLNSDTMVTKPDVVRCLDFFPKDGLSVTIETVSHTADADEELFYRLKITTYGGEFTYVYATIEQLTEIYNDFKKWLSDELQTRP